MQDLAKDKKNPNFVPKVDPTSEKWYDGENKTYYRRHEGSEWAQHFDQIGVPIGWYLNRTTNQLVNQDKANFDPGTRSLISGRAFLPRNDLLQTLFVELDDPAPDLKRYLWIHRES